MDIEAKRKNEQEMLGIMMKIYCRGNHKQAYKENKALCMDCQRLLDYAYNRTAHCPFMETKTFCSACKVHCYAPQMREQIKKVMKYAGPRMIFYHPAAAIKHLRVTLAEKRRTADQNRQSEGGKNVS